MQSKAKLCSNIKKKVCRLYLLQKKKKRKYKFLETQTHNVMSALWCCQFHFSIIALSCEQFSFLVPTVIHMLSLMVHLHVESMFSQTLLQQSYRG